MKLSSFNKDVKNITKLSDRPNIENGYTANALKELFDKAGVDIKEYINTVLIEELASNTDNASGADRIGSGAIDTVYGDTVQEKLVSLSAQVNDLANGTIPDGSVTPDKFAPDIAAFLTSASIRASFIGSVGESNFVVERNGIYKFTIVGGGAGGGVQPSDSFLRLGGGGGAAAVLWLELKAGDSCVVNIGAGGKGMQVSGTDFVSAAQNGEDTTLTVNGVRVMTAQGGVFGTEVRAVATGGTLNYSGGYPMIGGVVNGSKTKIEFVLGGNSLLGYGATFSSDVPGIGGGGYGGKYIGSGIYYKGYDGGNGCAIIEYMN